MGSQATSSLVGLPLYRQLNLAFAGIHLRQRREKLPTHIESLVEDMLSKGRQSPEPAVEDIGEDSDVDDGDENTVTQYFERHIFENPKGSRRLQGLGATKQFYLIRQEHVPSANDPTITVRLPVSRPKPDLLYGYDWKAFTLAQQQFMAMDATEHTANSGGLIYPFLVVELKGHAGSLWMATNQCLGSAAACVNMVVKLNQSIEALATVSPVDTTVFSIAMNGTEVRLFASWREFGEFYTQQIGEFLVSRPQEFIQFRRFVRNVLEWGKDYRRPQIAAALDALREESQRKKAAVDTADSQDTILRRSKRVRQ
jgi:hypothetical protein